ncbi:polysaccharide biosynthesis C-terminal domain-containing protein [Aquimarina gracilis]|uniref:Polysaccharide biosynthesis C-terminal domain-containing protein n=1 Tax=Aquimarina gracilis TaxID=874422 RepID=A0ABU6A1Q4_9FLAO|nr:polysaccharide biosynthesis C-terminal domain-containing protein [Aquimarina gracilis]MEB3348034.1 polysaccharide biosynthesis C-terminal domain-containing protein [Aquimarina gracilis]
MGIVVNQSIKNVIITCLGFGIGAINTLFLFTNFMDEKHYGLVAYLMSASNLIWPLMTFGVHNTLIKFFSAYTDTDQQNKFLTQMLLIPFMVSIIIGLFGLAFYTSIINFMGRENDIVAPYVWTIFLLAFALSYFEVFFAWSKVKLKSVFGNVMKELFLRVFISLLLFLLYFKIISIDQFVYGLVIVYLIRTFIMKIYAFSLHKFSPIFSFPNNYISVFKYTFLILIAGSVASLLIDLDKVMIKEFLPIENVAKYGICAYIASVIIIPSRAMHQITYPLTAKLINEKSWDKLKELYKKSSLNLFIVSGVLFVLIICNVKQLFEIIPDEYELFMWVVILIGTTKLFDNLLGNNNSILYNSDYYRIVLYIGIGMAVLSFVLNIICIQLYGVTGAAIATFSAVFCYNITKLWIVNLKFKMHPFSKNIFLSVLLITAFTFGFYYWDFGFHPILNIVLKSVLISGVYFLVVYILKLSPDINAIIKKIPRGA